MSAIPIPYTSGQTIYGHYKCAQRSGSIATATPLVAASVLASLRWTGTGFCVVTRVRCGFCVNATITTATVMDFSLTVVRGFSADYSSNNTQAKLADKPKSGAMRAFMANSQMGSSGPQIATTLGMTGATNTIDTDYMSTVVFPSQATTAGIGGQMFDLYQLTSLGDHPPCLSANEGLIIRNISTGPASGTYLFYAQWEWAEVSAF